MATKHDDEVDGNFEMFQSILPTAMDTHRGEYALLRHRKVEGYYPSLRAALDAGRAFADRLFSVQEVTDRPADLGLFSHANNSRLA